MLLQHGADVNAMEADGRTPLFCATELGNIEIAQYLLQRGAAVDAQIPNGSSPLHRACRVTNRTYRPALVALLLTAGADRTLRDNRGKMPADYAADAPELLAMLAPRVKNAAG